MKTSGVIDRPEDTSCPKGRGDSHQTPGGAMGIYVGTSPSGRDWYAYDPAEFLAWCEAFDARFR